jgi:hypothetical protein
MDRMPQSVFVVQIEDEEDEASDDENGRKSDGLPVQMVGAVAPAASVGSEHDQTDDQGHQTGIAQDRLLHGLLPPTSTIS